MVVGAWWKRELKRGLLVLNLHLNVVTVDLDGDGMGSEGMRRRVRLYLFLFVLRSFSSVLLQCGRPVKQFCRIFEIVSREDDGAPHYLGERWKTDQCGSDVFLFGRDDEKMIE